MVVLKLNKKYKIFLCHILNPLSDLRCDVLANMGLVCEQENASEGYKFAALGNTDAILKQFKHVDNVEIIDYLDQWVLPPFYDMHFHWVQDDVSDMPKKSLLKWLEDYTFPHENKFKDRDFCQNKVNEFTRKIFKCGTLGGLVYSSIHPHATEMALQSFKGEFSIGNVLMNMNAPDYLCVEEKQCLDEVANLAQKYKDKYILTPRFAITTLAAVMKQGAQLAKNNSCYIQTHLAETEDEIDFVLKLYQNEPGFSQLKDYLDIYDRCQLLGPKTMMGHGIYLSERELKRLATTKTWIAHCPTSNAPVAMRGLGSGLFDFIQAEKLGVDWALASDIGGGPFLSMFDVMRAFVILNAAHPQATYIKALYRATVKGASFFSPHKAQGHFQMGMQASFITVAKASIHELCDAEKIMKELVNITDNDRISFQNSVKNVIYRGDNNF